MKNHPQGCDCRDCYMQRLVDRGMGMLHKTEPNAINAYPPGKQQDQNSRGGTGERVEEIKVRQQNAMGVLHYDQATLYLTHAREDIPFLLQVLEAEQLRNAELERKITIAREALLKYKGVYKNGVAADALSQLDA